MLSKFFREPSALGYVLGPFLPVLYLLVVAMTNPLWVVCQVIYATLRYGFNGLMVGLAWAVCAQLIRRYLRPD